MWNFCFVLLRKEHSKFDKSMNPYRLYGACRDRTRSKFFKFLGLNSAKTAVNMLLELLDKFEVFKYFYFDKICKIPTFPDLAVYGRLRLFPVRPFNPDYVLSRLGHEWIKCESERTVKSTENILNKRKIILCVNRIIYGLFL